MNRSEIDDEVTLKRHLHSAENNLDKAVLNQLAAVRTTALEQENRWFKGHIDNLTTGYRGLFSASLITAALATVVLLPTGQRILSGDESGLFMDDSVTLLMEDPEFYLWLNETGMLVVERWDD